jgi:hypothetical protein
VILVPKYLLRALPTINRDSFQDYLWQVHSWELREEFNVQAKRDIARRVIEIANAQPMWIRDYVALQEVAAPSPYSFEKDPLGSWATASYTIGETQARPPHLRSQVPRVRSLTLYCSSQSISTRISKLNAVGSCCGTSVTPGHAVRRRLSVCSKPWRAAAATSRTSTCLPSQMRVTGLWTSSSPPGTTRATMRGSPSTIHVHDNNQENALLKGHLIHRLWKRLGKLVV